jgi:hypothetical protein
VADATKGETMSNYMRMPIDVLKIDTVSPKVQAAQVAAAQAVLSMPTSRDEPLHTIEALARILWPDAWYQPDTGRVEVLVAGEWIDVPQDPAPMDQEQ